MPDTAFHPHKGNKQQSLFVPSHLFSNSPLIAYLKEKEKLHKTVWSRLFPWVRERLLGAVLLSSQHQDSNTSRKGRPGQNTAWVSTLQAAENPTWAYKTLNDAPQNRKAKKILLIGARRWRVVWLRKAVGRSTGSTRQDTTGSILKAQCCGFFSLFVCLFLFLFEIRWEQCTTIEKHLPSYFSST